MKLNLIPSSLGCLLVTLLMPGILTAQTIDFGTKREPQTCSSRSAPMTGAINVAQAKRYFTCGQERKEEAYSVNGGAFLELIDNLQLKIAPKPRRVNFAVDVIYTRLYGGVVVAIDTEKPVYDIRGSYTRWSCYQQRATMKTECKTEDFSASQGICFRDTFGGWYCSMRGNSTNTQYKLPVPQS